MPLFAVFEQVGRKYRATVISVLQMSYMSGIMLTAVMVTQSPVSTELLMIFPTLAIIYHVLLVEWRGVSSVVSRGGGAYHVLLVEWAGLITCC